MKLKIKTFPKRLWITFCSTGEICPKDGEGCPNEPHSSVQYVNSEWVKTERTQEEVDRWNNYLETSDRQFLDADRVLEFACLPVWCKKCGVRAVRHLILENATQEEAQEQIRDSICGRCRGINFTPEELQAQDEYEQTEEAKNMMPQGQWIDDEWHSSAIQPTN